MASSIALRRVWVAAPAASFSKLLKYSSIPSAARSFSTNAKKKDDRDRRRRSDSSFGVPDVLNPSSPWSVTQVLNLTDDPPLGRQRGRQSDDGSDHQRRGGSSGSGGGEGI